MQSLSTSIFGGNSDEYDEAVALLFVQAETSQRTKGVVWMSGVSLMIHSLYKRLHLQWRKNGSWNKTVFQFRNMVTFKVEPRHSSRTILQGVSRNHNAKTVISFHDFKIVPKSVLTSWFFLCLLLTYLSIIYPITMKSTRFVTLSNLLLKTVNLIDFSLRVSQHKRNTICEHFSYNYGKHFLMFCTCSFFLKA